MTTVLIYRCQMCGQDFERPPVDFAPKPLHKTLESIGAHNPLSGAPLHFSHNCDEPAGKQWGMVLLIGSKEKP